MKQILKMIIVLFIITFSYAYGAKVIADNELIVIAKVEVKKENIDFVKSNFLKLAKLSLQENGCISYTLHQDNKRPEIFITYEKWENAVFEKKHMENINVQTFLKNIKSSIISVTIDRINKIN